MILQTFPYAELSIQSYLIGDEASKECIVIDPPRVIKDIAGYISKHNLKLKAVLETHVHADFVSGALELKHAFGSTPVICCSEAGGSAYVPRYADRRIHDGDEVVIGTIRLVARHTPGHTPEHLTWLCYEGTEPKCAFTGDFLFVGGVGRPDLLGDDKTPVLLQELHNSLFQRIADLPDSLRIFPSHGAGSLCGKTMGSATTSTLGTERKTNSAFLPADMASWTANQQSEMPAIPKTFPRNKRINLMGAPLLTTVAADTLSANPDIGQIVTNQGWVLDFRDPIPFGRGHIKGAINVPITPATGNWLAALLPDDVPLLCILPDGTTRGKIVDLIRTLGYDQPVTFALWNGLVADEGSLTSLPALSPEELRQLLEEKGDDVYLIDVRTPAEWNEGHISSAHHIELSRLPSNLAEIPPNKQIVTVCRSGTRSSIAASVVQRAGYASVSHLAGGMTAWKAMKV